MKNIFVDSTLEKVVSFRISKQQYNEFIEHLPYFEQNKSECIRLIVSKLNEQLALERVKKMLHKRKNTNVKYKKNKD